MTLDNAAQGGGNNGVYNPQRAFQGIIDLVQGHDNSYKEKEAKDRQQSQQDEWNRKSPEEKRQIQQQEVQKQADKGHELFKMYLPTAKNDVRGEALKMYAFNAQASRLPAWKAFADDYAQTFGRYPPGY